MNEEIMKHIADLYVKITNLEEELKEEKNINEKNLIYIDDREEYWTKKVKELQQENKQLKINCNIGMERLKELELINKQLKEKNEKIEEAVNKHTSLHESFLKDYICVDVEYIKEILKGDSNE